MGNKFSYLGYRLELESTRWLVSRQHKQSSTAVGPAEETLPGKIWEEGQTCNLQRYTSISADKIFLLKNPMDYVIVLVGGDNALMVKDIFLNFMRLNQGMDNLGTLL